MNRWVSRIPQHDFEVGWSFTRRRADGGYDVRMLTNTLWAEGEEDGCRRRGPARCLEARYSKQDVAARSPHLTTYRRRGDHSTPDEYWPGADSAARATFLIEDEAGPRARSCGYGSIQHLLPDDPKRIVWPGGPESQWPMIKRRGHEFDLEFVRICAKYKQRWLP